MESCPVKYDPKARIWSNPSQNETEENTTTIGQYILNRLDELDPKKVIEINHDTNQKWTIEDYKRLSVTCALNLKELGVKKGDIVLYFCSLNPFVTVSVFACYYLGAIVHPVDVNCTEDDLEYSLSIIDPTIVLCDDNAYERVITATGKKSQKNLKHVLSFASSRIDRMCVKDVLFKSVDGLNDFKISPDLGDPEKLIAVLLSSSGSTGRPKVSILSHSTLFHGSLMWWNPNEKSVIFCASLFRWISQSAMFIQSIFYQFPRVVTGQPLSGQLVASIIEKYKITHIFALPTLLIDTFEYSKEHNLDLGTLEIAMTGGENPPEYLTKIGGQVVPSCNIIKAYGMTEVGRSISSNEFVKDKKSSGYFLTEGMSVKIIDSNMKNLGPNQKGQICIKPKYVFSGYWNNARKTSEAFDEDGWILTGDFGYVDDDNLLYIVNRYKDILQFDGKLIFPTPIEQVLESHPSVLRAIVVGIPHEKGQQPIVFIQLKPEKQIAIKTDELKKNIQSFLETHYPCDQLPHGGIYFRNEFPLTFTGKVYREALKKIALDLVENK